jgi:hypothetical protein
MQCAPAPPPPNCVRHSAMHHAPASRPRTCAPQFPITNRPYNYTPRLGQATHPCGYTSAIRSRMPLPAVLTLQLQAGGHDARKHSARARAHQTPGGGELTARWPERVQGRRLLERPGKSRALAGRALSGACADRCRPACTKARCCPGFPTALRKARHIMGPVRKSSGPLPRPPGWCPKPHKQLRGNIGLRPTTRARNRKKIRTLLDLCVSSLRRGHANLLCIVPILSDDPRRESNMLLHAPLCVQ